MIGGLTAVARSTEQASAVAEAGAIGQALAGPGLRSIDPGGLALVIGGDLVTRRRDIIHPPADRQADRAEKAEAKARERLRNRSVPD